MSDDKISPLPWRMSPWHIEEGPSAVRTGEYPNDYIVCTTASDEDAAFIVLATSLHHELVRTLEGIADFCSSDASKLGSVERLIHIQNTARAVLAKAKQPNLEEPRG